MKICIIGSSGHFNYVFEGLKGCNIASIEGLAPGSAGENIESVIKVAAKEGHSPKVFASYQEMLAAIKPDIAVVNCFFADQARITADLLEKGIHAFVEKPIATTLEDLEMLKSVYKKSDAYLCPMFGIRYTPWFLTASMTVQAGVIGEIRMMNAQKSYKLGTRGEHFKKREKYGGTILWVGSHAIDWLYWFSRKEFKSVYATHSTMYNNNHEELEVSAICHFNFSDEIFGSVNIDYLRPSTATGHSDDRIRIVGTKGILEVRENKVFLINSEGEGLKELTLLPERRIFADFLSQVKDGVECMVSAEDAFVVTKAAILARLSADKGKICHF